MKSYKKPLVGIAGTAIMATALIAGAQETDQNSSDYPQPNRQSQKHSADGQMTRAEEQRSYGAHDLTTMATNELEGKRIVNENGEEVGDIDSIKVDTVTQKKVAIVGIKGVVGAAAKEVAVPLRELQPRAGGDALQTRLTQAQLESMQDVDPMDDRYQEIEEAE